MKISVQICRHSLTSRGLSPADSDCGAVVEFAGVVRAQEDSAPLAGLRYQAYESMALSEMAKILRSLEESYPCHSVEVWHRLGDVPVGEASLLVRIESRHRAEAFGLLAAFMDRLKKDVPIWKIAP